jgi:hypothetical protein
MTPHVDLSKPSRADLVRPVRRRAKTGLAALVRICGYDEIVPHHPEFAALLFEHSGGRTSLGLKLRTKLSEQRDQSVPHSLVERGCGLVTDARVFNELWFITHGIIDAIPVGFCAAVFIATQWWLGHAFSRLNGRPSALPAGVGLRAERRVDAAVAMPLQESVHPPQRSAHGLGDLALASATVSGSGNIFGGGAKRVFASLDQSLRSYK